MSPWPPLTRRTTAPLASEAKILAEAAVPPTEARLNLKPRTVEVEMRGRGRPAGGWRVVLDPGGELGEVTEGNNVASGS